MAKCSYNRAWVGPCGKETDALLCPEHASKRCESCGEQATRECPYTGQFVCGFPLCDTCVGTEGDSTKGLGWGFIGHRHVRPAPSGAGGKT